LTHLQKKICLLGDFAVGKTSLIGRFVEGHFSERYLSTIGVRVSRRVIQIDQIAAPTRLTLLVWDTAGGEPFSSIVQSYYRGASGALLVCDLTRGETLTSLMRYTQDFHSVNPGAPLVLVGNKADLTGQRAISDEQVGAAAGLYGAPWVLASARTGEQVEAAFQALGTSLVA